MSTPLPKVLALIIMVICDVYLLWTSITDERWGWLAFSVVPISATIAVALLPWDRSDEVPQ